MVARCAGAAVVLALFAWCLAGIPSAELTQTLRKRGMHLADFGNDGYQIAFPPEDEPFVAYPDQKSDYLASTVAPSGRSLFALRRLFDGRTPPRDLLVRRSLADHEAPEENISSAFKIVQDFAFSPSERFAVIGGRLSGDAATRKETDGIFLWDRDRGTITYLAPYLVGLPPNGVGSTEIRSLNVSDGADLVVYEDNGTVVRLSAANGVLSVAERQPVRISSTDAQWRRLSLFSRWPAGLERRQSKADASAHSESLRRDTDLT